MIDFLQALSLEISELSYCVWMTFSFSSFKEPAIIYPSIDIIHWWGESCVVWASRCLRIQTPIFFINISLSMNMDSYDIVWRQTKLDTLDPQCDASFCDISMTMSISMDRLYLQLSWTIGRGWKVRLHSCG